jgi:hypothetical protein
MRSDLASLGFVVTLLSASLAHGQVMIDVSKITCDQFAQGKVGLPRTTAIKASEAIKRNSEASVCPPR